MEAILALDGAILLWIQDVLRVSWLTPVITTITKMGNLGFIWILLSLLLLCFKKTRMAGAAGILALIFSLMINNVFLKNLFARVRPYEVIAELELLTAKASDWSFPSGHAGSSFAAAVAIFCTLKSEPSAKWRWLVLIFAFLMAFSRLYIGIHYPTDVLAGALTGTCCGLLSAYLIKKAVRPAWERLRDPRDGAV